jgi:hypothetical protein
MINGTRIPGFPFRDGEEEFSALIAGQIQSRASEAHYEESD